MFSIAEWTDRASALSYPKKLTSSASFSPSIRISLRLKIHQAQAKNFCRVLDIRVSQIVETHLFHSVPLNKGRKLLRKIIGIHSLSQFIHKYISVVLIVVAVAADLLVQFLRRLDFSEVFSKAAHQRKCAHTGFCFC